MNFLSRLQRREIIIDFWGHTIIADLLANSITLMKDNKNKVIEFKEKRDDIFVSQLNYFFGNIRKNKMMNNLREASKIFDTIMLIRKAAK